MNIEFFSNSIRQTLHEGGTTLYALLVLAVTIYATLFSVWRHLAKSRKPDFPSGRSHAETHREYAAYELDEMAWVERRLPFLAILISTAPLLGLLGTVAGMFLTFSGMASGSAAPIDTISTGISRALVTTEAGLVIAIPAAFLLALLKRRAQTTHLEMQRQLHRQLAGTVSSSLKTENLHLAN